MASTSSATLHIRVVCGFDSLSHPVSENVPVAELVEAIRKKGNTPVAEPVEAAE